MAVLVEALQPVSEIHQLKIAQLINLKVVGNKISMNNITLAMQMPQQPNQLFNPPQHIILTNPNHLIPQSIPKTSPNKI